MVIKDGFLLIVTLSKLTNTLMKLLMILKLLQILYQN